MTNEEKYKAIVQRASLEGWVDDPTFISVMVIVHYIDQLKALGLVDCVYQMTDTGKRVAAICEEFDWKPSDEDISRFVTEMIDEVERPIMEHMIRRYRDDKQELMSDLAKMQKLLDEETAKPKKAKKKSAKKKKKSGN